MTKKLVISVKYGDAKPIVVGSCDNFGGDNTWQYLDIEMRDLKVFTDSAKLIAHMEEIDDEE